MAKTTKKPAKTAKKPAPKTEPTANALPPVSYGQTERQTSDVDYVAAEFLPNPWLS